MWKVTVVVLLGACLLTTPALARSSRSKAPAAAARGANMASLLNAVEHDLRSLEEEEIDAAEVSMMTSVLYAYLTQAGQTQFTELVSYFTSKPSNAAVKGMIVENRERVAGIIGNKFSEKRFFRLWATYTNSNFPNRAIDYHMVVADTGDLTEITTTEKANNIGYRDAKAMHHGLSLNGNSAKKQVQFEIVFQADDLPLNNDAETYFFSEDLPGFAEAFPDGYAVTTLDSIELCGDYRRPPNWIVHEKFGVCWAPANTPEAVKAIDKVAGLIAEELTARGPQAAYARLHTYFDRFRLTTAHMDGLRARVATTDVQYTAIDDFVTDMKKVETSVFGSSEEELDAKAQTILEEMLAVLRRMLECFKENPVLMELVDRIERRSRTGSDEYIPKSSNLPDLLVSFVTYSYFLDIMLTSIDVNPAITKIFNYYTKWVEVVGLEDHFRGMFEYLKYHGINYSFKGYSNFGSSHDTWVTEAGDSFKDGCPNSCEAGLTANVHEAVLADVGHGWRHNAAAGIFLECYDGITSKTVYMCGDDHTYKAIYEAWNFAFVSGNYEQWTEFWAKLATPLVFCSRGAQYLHYRLIALWMHFHHQLFGRVEEVESKCECSFLDGTCDEDRCRAYVTNQNNWKIALDTHHEFNEKFLELFGKTNCEYIHNHFLKADSSSYTCDLSVLS